MSRNHGAGGIGRNSAQEITPQSEITANISVDTQLYLKRRKGVKDPNSHMNPPANTTEVHVGTNEMMFGYKNAPGFGGFNTAFSSSGFTAFNGVSINNVETQEQFENQFVLLGMTNGPVYFEQDVTTNEGSACRIRGSGTIPVNISDETLYPGDYIGWKLHSIDARTREVEIKSRPNHPDAPIPTKLVGIPTRVTYEDFARWWDDVSHTLSTSNTTGKLDIQNYLRDAKNGRNVRTYTEEVAINTKIHQFLNGFNMVATLMELGLIIPSYAPNSTNKSTSPTLFNPSKSAIHASQFENSIKNISPATWSKYSVSTPSSGSTVPNVTNLSTASQQEYRKAHVSDFLEYLSGKLGLVKDIRRSWLREDFKITKAILLRNNYSNLKDPKLSLATKSIIGRDFIDNMRMKDAFGKEITTSTIAGQMYDLQSSSTERHWKTVGRVYDHKLGKVWARCTNLSKKGNPIHYNI